MEHIIKQTDEETIKRFELNKKNIWLVKKYLPTRGIFGYGIGETKKKAEAAAHKNQTYAYKGIPDFINELGSYKKTNSIPQVNSVPGALKFIHSYLPTRWHSRYFFRIILDQNSDRTFLEVAFASESLTHWKPLQYWSDDKKGFHQQLLNCIYQFYIDCQSPPGPDNKQNIKLGEWQKVWYSKLVPRRIP